MKITFKSLKDLVEDVHKILPRIPRDVGIVYGISRSGVLPATIIATNIGAELGIISGIPLYNPRHSHYGGLQPVGKKVLLVDDSICTGTSLEYNKKLLGVDCITCVIYTNSLCRDSVDIYGEVIDSARFFEWNLLRNLSTPLFSFDMDGVLCADPTAYDNDGPEYENAVINALPLYIPQTKIRMICTNRIERWRQQTEAWLKKYSVQYDKLIMQPYSTAVERRHCSNPAEYKAKHFIEERESPLFVESNMAQAKTIWIKSQKPVLSIEGMKLFWDGK
jgi:hypoxanthine phosphoribosyltransferase